MFVVLFNIIRYFSYIFNYLCCCLLIHEIHRKQYLEFSIELHCYLYLKKKEEQTLNYQIVRCVLRRSIAHRSTIDHNFVENVSANQEFAWL